MTMLRTGVRYGFVAGICMVVHNLILISGNAAGMAIAPLVVISFCTVILLGFTLHTRVTFSVAPDMRSFVRYTLAMAANVPLTIVILWILVDLLGWSMVVAAPAGTLILVLVNFVTTQWAIAARRRRGHT